MTENHKKAVYLLSVAIFVLFCGAVGYYIGVPMIRFVREPEAFRQWVDSYGVVGRGAFVGMVVLQVIVALIPGEPLELAAGYAFGAVEGTILSLIGIILGSWLVFSLVRRFGVKLVEVFFSREQILRFRFLRDPKKPQVIAFILMTIPGTPKDFLSYFAGLTQLRLDKWLLIVSVARIPSLVTSTVSGAAAGEQNYLLAAVMVAFSLLTSGIGILYYRKLCKEQSQMEEENRKIAS